MTDKKGYLLILSLLIIIPTYLFSGYIKEKYGVSIFYIGTAITFFLMALYITIVNSNNRFLTTIILFSTTNNLLDELFFNPISFELNEKIFAVLLIIYIIILFYGKRTNRGFAYKIYNYVINYSVVKSYNK